MSGEMESCVKCQAVLFYEDEKVLIRDTGEIKYISTREQGHLISVYCVPCATAIFDAIAEEVAGA
jgi:predicted nucleic-acid-binding Zn-ribbon protein